MLRLKCPYCHLEVDETELAPGGEGHIARMGPQSTDEEFSDYLFSRDNPKGVYFEKWRHAYGCGKWFLVARCTRTLEVFGSYEAQTSEPPQSLLDEIAKRRRNPHTAAARKPA